MRKLLLISFDFIREGEPNTSLAIGSIMSYLYTKEEYGSEFEVKHHTINMFSLNSNTTSLDIAQEIAYVDFNSFNFIAISAYVWNEKYLNDLMHILRIKYSFSGKFILGGYQISYSNNPSVEYPNCDLFVDGYGEDTVYQILMGKYKAGLVKSSLEFSDIPSPYTTGIIPISENQSKVRIETKRGCPYKCTFCAHRDLTNNKVLIKANDRVFEELIFFKNMNVNKINILDPIFNAGKDYLVILNKMVSIGLTSLVSIQTRFETISGEKGQEFLNLCEKLNIHLEFGLQTAIRNESILIKRKNQPEKIASVMEELNNRGISYEVSLIYGLPSQTLNSFNESIKFLKKNGCHNIKAFPLMLLKGTELYLEKEKYKMEEKTINEFDIPVVVKSDSFTEKEWLQMKERAEDLEYVNDRV
ncbi:radical SAM protein [Nonlabens sp.]|uniref:B12-binding domain-containing radical SAM protein n=1 Tax=Nonlabens sp. TaxID=1888209 RepID=UPI00326569A9